jgi:DMSO reductase family type II enzyme heme b subunit
MTGYRNTINSNIRLILGVLLLAVATLSSAKPGDTEQGEKIYFRRCVLCHGEEGDGLGPAAERLNPPPRDFTAGTYKIKTTGFEDMVPNDEDIYRMIRDGMPGTAMPEWADILSEQEIWDLVAYIKIFAAYDEEEPGALIDYGEQIASSPESIEKGNLLYHDQDRCSECHGEEGKGNASKRLKDDNGDRTWPRNQTKAWTFRASNDALDIFTRITTGIAGTQMQSFADPKSNKKLSIEERWHVANYVQSLAKTEKVVNAENTVVKAEMIDGELPDSADDPRWQSSQPTTFFLVPQIIAEQRFFTPSNDTITVRALYSDTELAILLEWDDRTGSIPGNELAEKISDADIGEDAVAIQLPVKLPDSMEKPYFGMGDASHPVNIWHWHSGTTETAEGISLLNSKGFKEIEKRDAVTVGIGATGIYNEGTWRVVMKRPLTTEEPDKDLQFVSGKFIPIAFAAWDGSNSEKGSRHTMTTWYWLLLKPARNNTPLLMALGIFIVILVAELWWARSALQKRSNA